MRAPTLKRMFSSTFFDDREDAAEQLAAALQEYRGRNPLVLAIPRGAVPIGHILAERLQGELDLVLVHKLSAPSDPEYAIGAVDESGWAYVSPLEAPELASNPAFEAIRQQQVDALRQRRASYTPWLQPISPAQRICIVVDDGLATGATMIAALHAVRAKGPTALIGAVPVAAHVSLPEVEPLADRFVCLHAVPGFGAVSSYYARFEQIEDEEVKSILRRHARSPAGPQTGSLPKEGH